jgi:uncharacterized membrane protein
VSGHLLLDAVSPPAAVVLAFVAAAAFGLALVVTQFGLRHLAAADGALISIPATALLFSALAPAALDLAALDWRAAAIFAAVGLFFPAAVTVLTYEANRRLGPTAAGALGGTAPVFALIAAVAVLGERPGAVAALATVAVILGIAILSWRPASHPPGSHSGHLPLRDLALPLAAAGLRGLAQAATKLGLALWPSAFAAGLIGYWASTLSLALDARFRRNLRRPPFNRAGAAWFALVGACNGAAVLALYAALARGPVSVVAPVVALYPLFALGFAVLLRRERLTARAALGTAVTVAGLAALLLG